MNINISKDKSILEEIIDNIIASCDEEDEEYNLLDIRIGVHWTFVKLKNGHSAVSSSAACKAIDENPHDFGYADIPNAGSLFNTSAVTVVKRVLLAPLHNVNVKCTQGASVASNGKKCGDENETSDESESESVSVLERSFALCCLAALIGVPSIESDETISIVPSSATSILMDCAKDKKIAVFGRFPFVRKLSKVATNVSTIELYPRDDEFPYSDMDSIIPKCDIVVITGATFANRTLDEVLELVKVCKGNQVFTVWCSFSALLVHYTLYSLKKGVNVIGGSVVKDAEKVAACVSQGGFWPQLRENGMDKITIIKK